MVIAAAAMGEMAWGQSRVGEEADQSPGLDVNLQSRQRIHQRGGRKVCNRGTGTSVSRREGAFPGGPVAKTPSSQCRGPSFNPQFGN